MFDTNFMEKYGVSDKYHNLPKYIQDARLKLINRVIDTGCTISKEEAINICKDEKLYNTLIEKEIITMSGNDVAFLYPVSAMETNHRVKLSDGREFCSMCAIDALGSYSLFHQDTEINSICSQTGDKIFVKIRDRQIVEHSPDDIHVVHVDLNKNKNWASTC